MKAFRGVSFLEGISYLVILCVTFGIISRDYVFMLGMIHGVLFMLYAFMSLQVSHKEQWSVVVWLLVFLASIIPFAFIAVELYLRKHDQGIDDQLL